MSKTLRFILPDPRIPEISTDIVVRTDAIISIHRSFASPTNPPAPITVVFANE